MPGVLGTLFIGACSVTTPAGGPGKIRMQGASSVGHGAEGWNLVQAMEITETSTHRITRSNEEADFGTASMHVVDTALTRQRAWAITWIGLPVIGLTATATIAAVTSVRARPEKAAAPMSG